MDPRLLDALRSHPEVHDWTVRMQRTFGLQTYLVGETVENVREVERVAYQVEVFNDHAGPAGPSRGSASLPLTTPDLERLDEILADAVIMASLVHNPPWTLPPPAPLPQVELADPDLLTRTDMLRASHDAVELIRDRTAAERAGGVRLSAAELFVDRVDDELQTSTGVTAETTATEILLEATLLARHGDDEAEYFRQARARRLDQIGLADTIRHGARFARDKVRARPPRTRIGPVVVAGEALGQMMGGNVIGAPAYLTQADASAAFLKISRFEVGAPVYLGGERSGDPLTLRANATHPFSIRSYRADADGVPAQDVLLIEDGILVARWATQRYGQYLGLPVTGRAGVAEVGPGTTPAADLASADGPAYRVVAFSAANVDALSGDFGMEIRLGYEVTATGEEPITGGSVTGNLFEAMAGARFSRETGLFADYAGPIAIRLEAVQVAGED